MTDNILKDKSFKFSLRILKLHKHLVQQKKEYTLSKQVYRSGTSVGANIYESTQAESRVDFIHKLGIARKEAVETEYWLLLFRDGEILTASQANSLLRDCNEIVKLLTASIKTAKENERSRKQHKPRTLP